MATIPEIHDKVFSGPAVVPVADRLADALTDIENKVEAALERCDLSPNAFRDVEVVANVSAVNERFAHVIVRGELHLLPTKHDRKTIANWLREFAGEIEQLDFEL
jgi:hypothetical protein